jgi:predicted SnoaL-like aldol condensation-catalyzing enzyme
MHTDRNRRLVYEFFEALRNADLSAFDRLVAAEYQQHNPQAANGRQGLKDFVAAAVHGHLRTWNMAVIDIFRFGEDGRIVEHWDVIQPVAESSVSGNDMFAQVTR